MDKEHKAATAFKLFFDTDIESQICIANHTAGLGLAYSASRHAWESCYLIAFLSLCGNQTGLIRDCC